MQITLSKLQSSLRRASETHFSKLSGFIIRHPLFRGLSRRRCKCQNLVMFWKFNLTNLSGHMTDMLWIPLAVILWTPMPANWCQVDLPSSWKLLYSRMLRPVCILVDDEIPRFQISNAQKNICCNSDTSWAMKTCDFDIADTFKWRVVGHRRSRSIEIV